MDEKLEEMVNSLQRNAALKSAREIEKSQAYQQGYAAGIEDLYRFIRQERIKPTKISL